MIAQGRLKVCVLAQSQCSVQASCAFIEKTSWFSLAPRPTTSDQWRQATCCIAEEEEGCVLKVYLEVSLLCLSPRVAGLMLPCRKQYCFNLFTCTCCWTPISVPRTSLSFFERIALGYTALCEPLP